MSKKEKKSEKKEDKLEKKRALLLDTLDGLADFCLDNIMALQPLLDEKDEIVAARAEERIFKYGTIIEILDTIADLADAKPKKE